MVPWPIAALALWYGAMAAASAVNLWKALSGSSAQPVAWPLGWCALALSLMCGLPLLKPWARTLAVWGSAAMAAATLSFAGLLVAGGRPSWAVLAAAGAAVHVVVIRYLQRPVVKTYFAGHAERGIRSRRQAGRHGGLLPPHSERAW